MEDTGTATRAMTLDGRVLVEDFKSPMMGMPFTGHGMQGLRQRHRQVLDDLERQHVHGLMVSEGTCDAKNACTLTGSWTTRSRRARSRPA